MRKLSHQIIELSKAHPQILRRDILAIRNYKAKAGIALFLAYKLSAARYTNSMHVAQSFIFLGEHDVYLANYENAIKNFEQALSTVKEKFTKIRSNIHAAIAGCHARRNRHQEAIDHYLKALLLCNEQEKYKLIYSLATSYVKVDEQSKAKQILKKLIDEQVAKCSKNNFASRYHHLLNQSCETLVKLNLHKEAIATLSFVLEQKPLATKDENMVWSNYLWCKANLKLDLPEQANKNMESIYPFRNCLNKKQLIAFITLRAEIKTRLNEFDIAKSLYKKGTALGKTLNKQTHLHCLEREYSFLESHKYYEEAYYTMVLLQELDFAMMNRLQERELVKVKTIYQNKEQELQLKNLTLINGLNAQLDQKTKELESKNWDLEKVIRELMEGELLRSQMNPHFIYNSLNAINSLIKAKENKDADKYLIKFSILTRRVFSNSSKESVSLHSEIDIVRKYLEIEKLRFNDRFDFEINIEEDIDAQSIKAMPLLLLPFAENSIKHGIFNLDSHKKGLIRMTVTQSMHPEKEKEAIKLTFTDNGVGIKSDDLFRDIEIKKSALYITLKRLHHFNKSNPDQQNIFMDTTAENHTRFTIYLLNPSNFIII